MHLEVKKKLKRPARVLAVRTLLKMLFPMSLLPKMWTNHNLLPAYFVTLEKYFATRHILDENARFVAVSNVMSPKQIKKHSLSLSRAAENEQPYTAPKNLILSSVADVCKTD